MKPADGNIYTFYTLSLGSPFLDEGWRQPVKTGPAVQPAEEKGDTAGSSRSIRSFFQICLRCKEGNC